MECSVQFETYRGAVYVLPEFSVMWGESVDSAHPGRIELHVAWLAWGIRFFL